MLSIFEFGIRWINYLFETTNHVCHFLIRSIVFRFCNTLFFSFFLSLWSYINFFLSLSLTCRILTGRGFVLSSHALHSNHFTCDFKLVRVRELLLSRLLCKLLKYSRGQSLSYFMTNVKKSRFVCILLVFYLVLSPTTLLCFSFFFNAFDWINIDNVVDRFFLLLLNRLRILIICKKKKLK